MDAFKQLQESALTQLPETFLRFLSKPAIILRRDLLFMAIVPSAAAAMIAVDVSHLDAFQAQAPPAAERIVDLDLTSPYVQDKDASAHPPEVLTPIERQDAKNNSRIAALKKLAQNQFWAASAAREDLMATKSSIEWAQIVLDTKSDMDDATREGIERGLKAETKDIDRVMTEFHAKKKAFMATQSKLMSMGAGVDNIGLEMLADVPKPEMSQQGKRYVPKA